MKEFSDSPGFQRIKSDLCRPSLFLWICILLLLCTGCTTVNVGYDFPDQQVVNILPDHTTKKEIRAVFGEPWRVGLENGKETWTYGKYSYRGTQETDAKDLVVRFNNKDIVESYTFSKTNR